MKVYKWCFLFHFENKITAHDCVIITTCLKYLNVQNTKTARQAQQNWHSKKQKWRASSGKFHSTPNHHLGTELSCNSTLSDKVSKKKLWKPAANRNPGLEDTRQIQGVVLYLRLLSRVGRLACTTLLRSKQRTTAGFGAQVGALWLTLGPRHSACYGSQHGAYTSRRPLLQSVQAWIHTLRDITSWQGRS